MAFEGNLEGLSILDLIQIMAYSERSGCLFVESSPEPDDLSGTIVFERGNIVVVHSPSSSELLSGITRESSPEARLSLRRVHALSALRELFDIQAGRFRFLESQKPLAHLDGVELAGLYREGALETGDLLVVLAKTMDEEHPASRAETSSTIGLGRREERGEFTHHREYERCGPVVIRASASIGDVLTRGYLTNLSLGGAFFHRDEPIEIGSELALSFELPWGLGPCRALCMVTWGRGEGPPAQRGSGMRFDELIDDTEDKLTQYLQRFARMAQRVGT